MAYFSGRRARFENFGEVVQEFEHIYNLLNRFCVVDAPRAPNAEDQGKMWVFRDSNVMRLYIRSDRNGAWTEIT